MQDRQLSAKLSDNHPAQPRIWTDVSGRETYRELQKRAGQRPTRVASHRRGHWFDPSIAHQQTAWSEPQMRLSDQAVFDLCPGLGA